MPRKYRSTEIYLRPDPRFQSLLAAKFINCLMHDGKKSIAQKVFYQAMDLLADAVKDEPPLKVFERAVENVKPMVEVRSKRIGGANYQVPVEVKARRRQALAFRWLLEAARGVKGKPMHQRLSDELRNAYQGEGNAMKKRSDVHRMAEANKAFAHFAW